MDLRLYTNPMSRGRTARWMLEEIGQPYEVESLDYGTAMKAPAYLAINPLGKVPTLRHGERIVTESAAICAYLADAFPDAGLAPPLDARADYYRWLFFVSGPLEAAIVTKALGVTVPEEQRSMVGFAAVPTLLDVLQSALERHSYLAGETFTAADVYVGSALGFGMRFGTIESRGPFVAYWERLEAREAQRRASALDDAAMAVS